MEDSTIGTIYAIKHTKVGHDEAVIEYWSNLTGVEPKYYGKRELMDIATMVFLDFLETADNPRFVIWNLFQYMQFDCMHLEKIDKEFDDRVRAAIWTTLDLTQVKDTKTGKYVNGFRELNI